MHLRSGYVSARRRLPLLVALREKQTRWREGVLRKAFRSTSASLTGVAEPVGAWL